MLARRSVVKGLAGLPLAAVLSDPVLAQAAAETTRLTRIRTAAGRDVAGALAIPEQLPAPAMVLVHEWWGLNDQIKAVAADFARQGYLALAVDLFGGRVTDQPEEARQLTASVDEEEARDTMAAWIQWIKNHQDSTRKVGTVGWCFGGGWALRGATIAPVDATVVYYGRVALPAEQLARLEGPVLGHFATQDRHITREMVTTFEQRMAEVSRPYIVYWYDANHAFANPTGNNFDKEDAQLAWQRTVTFLKETLG